MDNLQQDLQDYYRERLKERLQELRTLYGQLYQASQVEQTGSKILNALLRAKDYPDIMAQAHQTLEQLHASSLEKLIGLLKGHKDLEAHESTRIILHHLGQWYHQLVSQCQQEYLQKIDRIAHSLVGSGGTYGFQDISQAAALVEQSSEEEKLVPLEALLNRIEQHAEVGKSKKEITILVVQKDPELSFLIQKSLQDAGYAPTLVHNASKAWAELLLHSFRLIVTDWVLPDADGRQFVSDLRDHKPTQDIPILLLVSKASHQFFQHQSLEADWLLKKPFQIEDFVAQVQALLQSERKNVLSRPSLGVLPKLDVRVLLADDDPLIASIVTFRLTQEGYNVLHVDEGDRVVELLKKEPVSLLILDIKMPGQDGFSILKGLRQTPRFKHLPILILTSLGNEAHLIKGFELGANDYMTKPFSPEELLSRVRRLLLSPAG